MQLLNIDKISKKYGEKDNCVIALNDVSFSLEQGDFLAIMGASGSGKSTLLNCISTIDKPTKGNIFFKNIDLTKASQKALADYRAKNISYIFQSYNLITTLTAYENIVLPLQIKGEKISSKKDEIKYIVNKLDISSLLSKFPDELSGGQRQRVAIARALINNTSLLIADEPTGALDSANSDNLMNVFSQINREMNVTILMVTHDVNAAKYSSRLLYLKDGQIVAHIDRGNKDLFEYREQIDALLQ